MDVTSVANAHFHPISFSSDADIKPRILITVQLLLILLCLGEDDPEKGTPGMLFSESSIMYLFVLRNWNFLCLQIGRMPQIIAALTSAYALQYKSSLAALFTRKSKTVQQCRRIFSSLFGGSPLL